MTGLNEEFEELYAMPEKKKKKSDPKLCILMLQFTACLLLATAAICIRFFGGAFYEEVRARYVLMFEDDTSVSEVLSALSPKAENGDVSSGAGASDLSSETPESSRSESTQGVESTQSADASSGISSTAEESGGQTDAVSAAAGTAVQTSAGVSALNAVFSFDQVNRYAALSSANAFFMPTSGTVSSEYGYRVNPVTGIYALHSGIDLAAEEGTPVYAALAGEVTAVGESASYGIYIEVEHTGGVSTLYAHLSVAKVKTGMTVRRGGLIGLVGSTGRSTGPHLHFEVTVGDQTLNPRYLLPSLEDS
ncbi:MAG: M23 family metallopeptidase [Candidatus Howiella sp.]